MDSTLKWRARSVDIGAGEAFEFPFESPMAGCMVRFAFQVHQDLDLHFVLVHHGEEIHVEHGSSCQGEVHVADAGMCCARWENSWLSFGARSVSYEVVLVPNEHLALARTRRLLQLAESTTTSLTELIDALTDVPVHATDECGRTALHGAARSGNVGVMLELIRRGAPLEACCVRRSTALLEACANAKTESAALLLRSKADASKVDAQGQTVLHLVASCDNDDEDSAMATLSLLLQHRQQDARKLPSLFTYDKNGNSPMVRLAGAGLPGCLETFLEVASAKDGYTVEQLRALQAAAAQGHLECARLLLVRGAPPARTCGDAGSALHAAAKGGHSAALRLLMHRIELDNEMAQSRDDTPRLGTVVDAMLTTDSAWRTPLLCAASSGHTECVKLLVQARAPLEQCDATGNTALLNACSVGEPGSVQVLLEAGANPAHCNIKGMDALCCAAIGGHLPLLPLLIPIASTMIPDAMLHAAVAGQTRTALALAELCPLPYPPPEKPETKASSCTKFVQAFSRRCFEEVLALHNESCAADSHTQVAMGCVDGARETRPTAAATAAASAAVGDAESVLINGCCAAAKPAIVLMAAETTEAMAVRNATPSQTGGDIDSADETTTKEVETVPATEHALTTGTPADEEEEEALGDLTSIQEAIRQALDDDDDDDDDDDEDDDNTGGGGGGDDDDDDGLGGGGDDDGNSGGGNGGANGSSGSANGSGGSANDTGGGVGGRAHKDGLGQYKS